MNRKVFTEHRSSPLTVWGRDDQAIGGEKSTNALASGEKTLTREHWLAIVRVLEPG